VTAVLAHRSRATGCDAGLLDDLHAQVPTTSRRVGGASPARWGGPGDVDPRADAGPAAADQPLQEVLERPAGRRHWGCRRGARRGRQCARGDGTGRSSPSSSGLARQRAHGRTARCRVHGMRGGSSAVFVDPSRRLPETGAGSCQCAGSVRGMAQREITLEPRPRGFPLRAMSRARCPSSQSSRSVRHLLSSTRRFR
jgi:hypothetical protein